MEKIYVISPMAPSKSLPFFGSFVPVISRSLSASGWHVDESAVTPAQSQSTLAKVQRHLLLFGRIVALSFKRPKVILVHSPTWFSVLILLLLPKKSTYIVNIHGSEIHGRGVIAKIFWVFSRKLIRSADLVISPSQAFIENIVLATGVHKERCFSSPSGGFEGTRFFYTPKCDDVPRIGFVSRVTAKKGWRHFLAVYDTLKPSVADLEAVMIGDGPDRRELEAEIAKRPWATIRYLGALPQAELQKFYSQMSAFVFTSEITGVDTLGLVSVEAQACGVPVIATNSAITREYIEPSVNGFLPTRNSVPEFAASIVECLNWDADKRMRIAREASSKFETRAVGVALSERIQAAIVKKPDARSGWLWRKHR